MPSLSLSHRIRLFKRSDFTQTGLSSLSPITSVTQQHVICHTQFSGCRFSGIQPIKHSPIVCCLEVISTTLASKLKGIFHMWVLEYSEKLKRRNSTLHIICRKTVNGWETQRKMSDIFLPQPRKTQHCRTKIVHLTCCYPSFLFDERPQGACSYEKHVSWLVETSMCW